MVFKLRKTVVYPKDVINWKDMVTQSKIYINRRHAGIELGKFLEPAYKDRDVLVLCIPRGGVEVGYEVAGILNAQLSVLITKKLPHPDNSELAIGAAAEDGNVYLTALGNRLDKTTIDEIIRAQSAEIESRVRRFREGKPLPAIRDRIVIIVDDGIATGSTLVPAIKLCKERGAARIVVAAPVSGHNYAPEIDSLADEVKILEQPYDFYAVGQVYEDFHNLSDEEVIVLLNGF